VAGSCEHGNKCLGSIKGREFLHLLSYYKVLKKDSVSWSLFVRLFVRSLVETLDITIQTINSVMINGRTCRFASNMYEDRLKSSWTRLIITPSQNFVEVQ
jgi:hypothetical protein